MSDTDRLRLWRRLEPLRVGVPDLSEVERLSRDASYLDMEGYSDAFIGQNSERLLDYAKRWVGDPLHQWSRRWEYPFVASWAADWAQAGVTEDAPILDAGSGITFLPLYLASFLDSTVLCVDEDTQLAETWERILEHSALPEARNVDFASIGIEALPFDDESIGLVYSVSVIEHADHPANLLAEIYRVLMPGGRLILTFDLSLDGSCDLDLDDAADLVEEAGRVFNVRQDQRPLIEDIRRSATDPRALNTFAVRETQPALLPWADPSRAKPLSVACLVLDKEMSQ